jgi:hypothetical protein
MAGSAGIARSIPGSADVAGVAGWAGVAGVAGTAGSSTGGGGSIWASAGATAKPAMPAPIKSKCFMRNILSWVIAECVKINAKDPERFRRIGQPNRRRAEPKHVISPLPTLALAPSVP